MERSFYLDLATAGHRAPIATHLVLHEKSDAETVPFNGRRLGDIVVETAESYRTPLAIPLMDLTVEKQALLRAMGIADQQIPSHHFDEPPPDTDAIPATERMTATCEAIAHVASSGGSLVPVGMCIGPFSLMTKLVSDPITPVFMAANGMDAQDEPEIGVIEKCLEVALPVILQYIEAQIAAGAKAIIVCEPAANLVYFSPNQLAESFEIFERYVMDGMRSIRETLARHDVDLIFHDCGELTDTMVERFGTLDPAIISLGGSRKLWQDARLLPKTTVLYGNLPTKQFYSTSLTRTDVETMTLALLENMRAADHPFILGSECDILSVPGSEREISDKVNVFLSAGQ